MSAPRKSTGGRAAKRAAELKLGGEIRPQEGRKSPPGITASSLNAPERPPRGRSGAGASQAVSVTSLAEPARDLTLTAGSPRPKLPKPPQGHAGFKRRIERKPPRRDGTAPRYTNQSSRQQMLEAALKAASERGYESMRVAEITDSVGVTRQAFYAHFRDKRHCMAEALDPKLGAIERMAASLAESDPDSAARIAQLLDDLIAERYGSAEGTRGRIISAIGELLLEGRTLHEVTIGQIVKAAHIPQGDFYRQFSTKRECFAVFYERLVDELVAELGEGNSSPEECPAEHTRHELPASEGLPTLLRSLGEVLSGDPQRLRVLVVESAHLPESDSDERPCAWRGSLTAAVAELIATSQGLDADHPTASFLAASAVEVIRSTGVGATAVTGLPARLAGVGVISVASASGTSGAAPLAA